ncbi:MAG: hypothetical protein ABEH43_02435, partial [Flavobacteriales bacterium]
AKALSLYYDKFEIPKGAELYIYSEDKKHVIGGFTSKNNSETGHYATQLVKGDVSVIEYYEPASQKGKSKISISHIGHAYRMVPEYIDRSGERADPCEVDVNCSPEGDDWQDEKKGVVRVATASGGLCSGSLVNNTAYDCKPYVLYALHCSQNATASDFDQHVFYFNFEKPGCGSGSGSLSESVTGADLVSKGDASDFILVELENKVPQSYDPYFNGWDAVNDPSQSGVSIHEKKISTYTSDLQTTNLGSGPTHWLVDWVSTPNGHGVTEGGSSGSPIFNSDGQIVGTLTGGQSFCSDVPDPDEDWYGKVSFHWTSNGSTPSEQLEPWLDPNGTGKKKLEGTYYPCEPPTEDDAALASINVPRSEVCDTTFSPEVTIENIGKNTLEKVKVNYQIDGGTLHTYNWTGYLSRG